MIPQEIKDKIEAEAKLGSSARTYSCYPGDIHLKAFISGGKYGYSLALPEIKALKEWKESAMNVMPDYQAIGKALNVPLGQSVHDKILPELSAKDKRIKELEEALRGLLAVLPSDGNNIYFLGFSKAVREAEKLLNPKKQSTP